MNDYFDMKSTMYQIATAYEEAIDLLVSLGFDQMRDPNQRALFGKNISLEMALQMKEINANVFEKNLVDAIELNIINKESLGNSGILQKEPSIKIEGLLPCPVKVPLLEGFEKWLDTTPKNYKDSIQYEFKAASMGVDWLIESIEASDTSDTISDLFISAGFDLFFDQHLIGQYKSEGIFEDISPVKKYNEDFDNENLSLKDPNNHYSMLAVVPAVFLINTEELNGRDLPKSWSDILKPEFENSVSLPIGDFDLFNAILLNIHKTYGVEGVGRLGKSLLNSMHPSEMVKSHTKTKQRPIVTIMPYFFTKMTKNGGPMVAVWPEDGAIISPIFMITKSGKKDQLQPIVDFMTSKEVGEILSHQGLFPCVHPEVNNNVPITNSYMWLGWDYINNVDMGPLIKSLGAIFHENVG
jgi:ABC-type Fe3+ transport system substrate-binding protein